MIGMSPLAYAVAVIIIGAAMIALGAWMLRDVRRPIGVNDFVDPKVWCRSLDAYRDRAKERAQTLPAVTHCGGQRRRPLTSVAQKETASPSRPAAPASMSTSPRNVTALGRSDHA